MTDIKIGDKVRVANDHYAWLGKNELPEDHIFEVCKSHNDGCSWVSEDHKYIEIEGINVYPEDFEKVEEPVRFSVNMEDGPVNETPAGIPVPVAEGYISGKVIPTDTSFTVSGTGLGVYRPNLDDRKVGKVRVELVDDGFPLALREIAKVMTWAQVAKGYNDHDWQNLPNAEVALAAAASRHRSDHIKQRVVDGLSIKQCVDGESELLHKAHEAFGVLAQLELMLRGDIE